MEKTQSNLKMNALVIYKKVALQHERICAFFLGLL